MNEEDKIRLTVGALLHDVGKIVWRAGEDTSKHAKSGADYLQKHGIADKNILDAVRYHHAADLKRAALAAFGKLISARRRKFLTRR